METGSIIGVGCALFILLVYIICKQEDRLMETNVRMKEAKITKEGQEREIKDLNERIKFYVNEGQKSERKYKEKSHEHELLRAEYEKLKMSHDQLINDYHELEQETII